MSRTAAILLAAGSGKRMEESVPDKILTPLEGKPVFSYSAGAFAVSGVADLFVIVYRDQKQMRELAALAPTPTLFVPGGTERQYSVANALDALPADISHVFIHDCARPFIHPEHLVALHKIVRKEHAVVLAHRVTDTIKLHRETGLLKTLDRNALWAMETPQVFDRDLIVKAYNRAANKGAKLTDDAAAVELLRHPVALLENPEPNPKLTASADIAWFEYLARQLES
ncbi:MAG: hypothetical protein SynsKO_20980 [Synoicihabitans sp.]